MELDLRDRKILVELDLDSRQSLQSIGKKVGLSKEVVNYRIKKLVENGVIKNFYARIDTSKLGIIIFRAFVRLYNLTPKKEKDIINYIKANEKIGWCVLVDGNWDINFIYWAENVSDFSEFWRGLLSKYGEFIENKWISVFDRYIQFPKFFLLKERGKNESAPSFSCGRNEKMELDKNEINILSLLAADSRISTIELAKKTRLSGKSVAKKIRGLKEKKVITGFWISLGLREINYQYFKVHFNLKRFDKKRFESLIEFCRMHPNIIYSNELIGGADLEADIYAKNREELQVILNEFKENYYDLIKNIEILQYFEELKHNLFPRKT